MANILSFQEALTRTSGKPHLLLGNGFSCACRPDIFSYKSLFERADFTSLSPIVRKSFEVLGTTDFEQVMRALRQTATLVNLYTPSDTQLASRLQLDAEGLREVLANAIAQNHPDLPSNIPDTSYSSCRKFLVNFKNIYTLNYDLLLYWTLMKKELGPEIRHDDGFRTPEDGPEDHVIWEIENIDKQNIHYLHGALHIFDTGLTPIKYTWVNTGIKLIDQVRIALSRNYYPLIVAEGTSNQKKEHINHSAYLSRALRSLSSIGGSLFVFGHSLAPNDDHIFQQVSHGKISQLYVSIYGDPDLPDNQTIITRASAMSKPSSGRRKGMDVYFFDAQSAHVWG